MDKNILNAIIVALIGIFLLVAFRVYFTIFPGKQFNRARFVARIGIFAGFSALLYVVEVFTVKLPFFPSFLSLHFDEVPAFIAGFAYGPLAGVLVILIKTMIKLPFSQTFLVGEATDLILSGIYVFIVTFIYKKKRNLKGVALGFTIGTVVQVIIAMLLNVYIMIPLYIFMKGFKESELLYVMRLAVPAISDVRWSYAFLAVLPFNLVKDAIVIVLTFILYRSLHTFLRFEKKKV